MDPRHHPVLRLLTMATVMGLVVAGLALPLLGGAGLLARAAADQFTDLPNDLRTPPPPQRSRLLAADGSTIAEFFAEDRVVVPLSRISPHMQRAIVAVEDSRFFQHGGVDIRGTLRALFTDAGAGSAKQGGSTLTQQYVKNILVTQADDEQAVAAARAGTLSRKLREARYAMAMEKKLTKKQILEGYLNLVYFGEGAYGVEAAARRYFGVHAADLTVPQAAMLAGLVQAPSAYDPLRDPKAALARRNIVIDRMREVHVLVAAAAEQARQTPLGLRPTAPRDGCEHSTAPFFCDWVRGQLVRNPRLGRTPEDRMRALMTGGITIRTTLEPAAQRAAQQAADSVVPRSSTVATAVDVVQPGTGKVVAMAVDRGFGSDPRKNETRINLAVGGQSGFQAGSTFKVFTLAAALAQHVPLDYTLNAPPKMTVDGLRSCDGGTFPPYPVKNAEDAEGGRFGLVKATWESVNTYFVQLEQKTGVCAPWQLANAMGVRRADGKPLPQVPSLTLGSADVSPLEMASAYATFAAGGRSCEPFAITSVSDMHNRQLWAGKQTCGQAMPRAVAEGVTSVLRGVIDGPDPRRTGASASIGRPAAGKTGTTEGFAAAWFAGYTPQLATAVWVGDPRGGFAHPLRNVTVAGRFYPHVYGADLPAAVWHATMTDALAGLPPLNFTGAGAQVAVDRMSAPPAPPAPVVKPVAPVAPGPKSKPQPPARKKKHH